MIERIQAIVADLMRQHAYTSDQGIEPELTRLDTLIDEVVEMERPAVEEKKIRLDAELEPVEIVVDQAKLGRVLLFVVKDAVDALSRARVAAPIIRLRIARDGREIIVAVFDNARAYPRGEGARLLHQDAGSRADGSGFGLHYSANALEQMQGRIVIETLDPEPGKWVRLILPAAPVGTADDRSAEVPH